MTDIDVLRDLLGRLSTAVPDWVEELDGADPLALVLMLDDLRSLRQKLASIESYVEAQTCRVLPTKRFFLPDGRVVERGGGWQRKSWQHGDILSRLWRDAVEESAGDLDEAAMLLRERVRVHAGINYWRASIRDLGMDPDDFSVRDRQRLTVRISAKPSDGGA